MLPSNENIPEKYMKELVECLEGENPQTAVKFIECCDVPEFLVRGAWQIIPVVSSRLTSFNTFHKRQVFDACEEILNIIAAKCDPAEIILELLEQIEYSDDGEDDDDTKFCTILKALSKSLEKSGDKPRAIEWCIGTIKSYIEELPVPVSDETNDNESATEDSSSRWLTNDTQRLFRVYNSVLSFVVPFVKEASLPSTGFGKQKLLKDNLINFLFYLLGNPLCCVRENTSDEISALPEAIIGLVCALTGNFLRFISVLDDRVNRQRPQRQRQRQPSTANDQKTNRSNTLEEQEAEVPNIAYSNFYFYIITRKSLWLKSPQVYDPQYLLRSSLYLIKCLLENLDNVLVYKGLRFMDKILLRLDKRSVHANALQINIYAELFDNLVRVMVFCDGEVERKTALGIFHRYMEIFDMEARHLILTYLYDTAEHSGLLSLISGIVKSCVIESIESDPASHYFLGNGIRALLKRACRLPHGAATDLVEISEEVVAALNLLRFLVIRDRDNAIGISTAIRGELQNDYLTPLRKGLDLCRGHWTTKLRDLEKIEKTERGRMRDSPLLEKDVTITVGREQLPPMPLAEKLEFSRRALTSIDMMESILVRVNECIAENTYPRGVGRLWQSRGTYATAVDENGTERSGGGEAEEEYEITIKTRILDASLEYVHELGWSQGAITAGAESIGYPGVIHGLFPNGGAELVNHFQASCNGKLTGQLEEALRVRKCKPKPAERFIRDALERRLRMIVPYRKVWPQALALSSRPQNLPTALTNFLGLIDDICYHAGDKSVDFDWYTRRMALGSVYKATELYLLQDDSDDFQATWEFLDKSIHLSWQLDGIRSIGPTSDTVRAILHTTRNLLGLDTKR